MLKNTIAEKDAKLQQLSLEAVNQKQEQTPNQMEIPSKDSQDEKPQAKSLDVTIIYIHDIYPLERISK